MRLRRIKQRFARFLHATWPERPEHFCRNNGCQLGYLEFTGRTYQQHLAEGEARLSDAHLSMEMLRREGVNAWAEVDRLNTTIKDAPHHLMCPVTSPDVQGPCNCWKART